MLLVGNHSPIATLYSTIRSPKQFHQLLHPAVKYNVKHRVSLSVLTETFPSLLKFRLQPKYYNKNLVSEILNEKQITYIIYPTCPVSGVLSSFPFHLRLEVVL